MKKVTLCGLIGVIVITLVHLYEVISSLNAEYYDPHQDIVPDIISLVGWFGVVFFFVELY